METGIDKSIERHLAQRELGLGARNGVIEHEHAHRVAGRIAHPAQMPFANRRARGIEHEDADLRDFLHAAPCVTPMVRRRAPRTRQSAGRRAQSSSQTSGSDMS